MRKTFQPKLVTFVLQTRAMINRVLYVEDDPVSLFVGFTMLRESNAFDEVLSAKNGKEALDMLKEESVDLMIMDFSLPLVDGEELIRTAATYELSKNTPIAVITDMQFKEEDMTKLKSLPNVFFVDRKPIRKSQVPAMLELLNK